MKVSDLIDLLQNSEAGRMNLGNNRDGGITSHNYAEIMTFANAGLMDICKKKNLYQQAKIRVFMVPPKKLYELTTDSVMLQENNTPNSVHYTWPVKDFQFYPTITRINSIETPEGDRVTLNNTFRADSAHVRNANSFYLPKPEDFSYVDVSYRYSFAPLNVNGETTQEFSLPQYLHQALVYYVTYRLASGRPAIPTEERHRYLALYRNELKEFTDHNYEKEETTNNPDIFERNGFI